MLEPVEMLLVGHVCRDLTPEPRLGGTVTFSALTAKALGLRPRIVTSAPDEMLPLLEPLAGIPIQRVPSGQATTFVNTVTPGGRRQQLIGQAARLGWEHIPEEWRTAALVHLAPVADEIDPAICDRFTRNWLGLTPQGWMRGWDAGGRVFYKRWESMAQIAPHAGAIVLSLEDVRGDQAIIEEIARLAPVLVVTRGAEGCTVYHNDDPVQLPALSVVERDPTGAGDVFAAAFFTRLRESGDPLRAARFATLLAGYSVTRIGLASIPTQPEIEQALRLS